MRIEELLREMARSSRHQQASPELERKLAMEFRKQRMKRLLPLWTAAIAAMIIIGIWLAPQQQHHVPLPVRTETAVLPPPEAEIEVPVAALPEVPRQRVLVPVKKLPQQPVRQELRTSFYALGASAFSGTAEGYIVRVRVPRAAMASFGLPVNQELMDQRVDADLLVGDDGTARAIRFVRTIQ